MVNIICTFFKWLKKWKGALYYKNKKVKCDFNGDKQEGNYKFIWEDGNII